MSTKNIQSLVCDMGNEYRLNNGMITKLDLPTSRKLFVTDEMHSTILLALRHHMNESIDSMERAKRLKMDELIEYWDKERRKASDAYAMVLGS